MEKLFLALVRRQLTLSRSSTTRSCFSCTELPNSKYTEDGDYDGDDEDAAAQSKLDPPPRPYKATIQYINSKKHRISTN